MSDWYQVTTQAPQYVIDSSIVSAVELLLLILSLCFVMWMLRSRRR